MKFLVLDNQTEFQRLLAHHISVRWPDADITLLGPEKNGVLPDGFRGAGSDVILLGSRLRPTRLREVLKHWCRQPDFPPIICFLENNTEDARTECLKLGAYDCLSRSIIDHDELLGTIERARGSRIAAASTASLFVGDALSGPALRGYELVRRIAAGDVSSVYLARHSETQDLLVLKIVRQLPDASQSSEMHFERFLQEFELISSLAHPNIVRIADFGVGDDHAFITMEYFPDGDLRACIEGGMSADQAVQALREIGSALQAMHAVGILHRDLKPGNIMVRRDGSTALIDFGLAKRLRLDAEITGTGEIFGTPYYMSPEQGHAKTTDERSDIYSLGVIFYEMLTGEKPFKADSAMGIIYRHAHAERPSLPDECANLQPVLDRMIAIEPEARFASVDALFEALAQ